MAFHAGPGVVGSSCSFQLWVGNVPFDATENELKDVMSQAGRVVNIRVKYDAETGQSKGFAFVEYPDAETCQVALHRMSNTEIRGRRIRVDWATDELREKYGGGTGGPKASRAVERRERQERMREKDKEKYKEAITNLNEAAGGEMNLIKRVDIRTAERDININKSEKQRVATSADVQPASTFTPSDANVNAVTVGNVTEIEENEKKEDNKNDNYQNVCSALDSVDACQDDSFIVEIAQIMQTMSTAQLIYLLGHMQKLAVQSPEEARNLLTGNPQLTYALLHAQFLIGMINERFIPLSAEELQIANLNREERQMQLSASSLEVLQCPPFSSFMNSSGMAPPPHGQFFSAPHSVVMSHPYSQPPNPHASALYSLPAQMYQKKNEQAYFTSLSQSVNSNVLPTDNKIPLSAAPPAAVSGRPMNVSQANNSGDSSVYPSTNTMIYGALGGGFGATTGSNGGKVNYNMLPTSNQNSNSRTNQNMYPPFVPGSNSNRYIPPTHMPSDLPPNDQPNYFNNSSLSNDNINCASVDNNNTTINNFFVSPQSYNNANTNSRNGLPLSSAAGSSSSVISSTSVDNIDSVGVAPSNLVDEVIQNKEILNNILNSRLEDMSSWPEPQKVQVLQLQAALRLRGYQVINS